jgi:ABC-2 type transport system ATP-binding protein
MTTVAISVDDVSKQFRLYHDKNQYLKTTLLRGGRSTYEEFWALEGISFEIPKGSTFGIIGSNGSGKSTLLKCLTGILSPDRGNIKINGKVAAMLELGAGFHPELSGRENIFLNGAILGISTKEIERNFQSIIDFSGLEHFIDTPVKNYSSGMVVRLGFAIAISVEPEILIIDEVLAVGDAEFQQKCLEKIEDFRKSGRTIVLVSHGLADIARICDTVAWIEKGSLRELGPAVEVIDHYNNATHQAKPSGDGQLGQRWGSGEIEINDIQLHNSAGVESHALLAGECLSISFSLHSKIRLENVSIGVKLSHLHGQELWSTSSNKQSVQLPIIQELQKINIQLVDPPLLDGTYELTLSISDLSEVHVYDHIEKGVRFDVHQQHITDSGLIKIESQWKIEST